MPRNRLEQEERSGATEMLSNYLKMALRLILREKRYACIKIGGLAVGMAICVVIAQFIRFWRSGWSRVSTRRSCCRASRWRPW